MAENPKEKPYSGFYMEKEQTKSDNFISNYFSHVLKAFLFPFNKYNLLDTYSLLVVSVIVFFMDAGPFYVEIMLFSCAIVYCRRRMHKTSEKEKEHIFGFGFKVFFIVLAFDLIRGAMELFALFTSVIEPSSTLAVYEGFWCSHILSSSYIKLNIFDCIIYFFLVPFFISCSRRKNLYFETEDFIRTIKLIKEKFLLIFLTFLPFLVTVTVSTVLICQANILPPKNDIQLAIIVVARIIHDYVFLVTFVLAAQMYLSELKDTFDFSLKFNKAELKKNTPKKTWKTVLVTTLCIGLFICFCQGISYLKSSVIGVGKWIKCDNQREFRDYKPAACLLNDGNVLIVGGVDAKANGNNSAEIFNPKTKKYTSLGKLPLKKQIGKMAANIEKLNDKTFLILINDEQILYNSETKSFKNVNEKTFYKNDYPKIYDNGNLLAIEFAPQKDSKGTEVCLFKVNPIENTKVKLNQFSDNFFDEGQFKINAYRFDNEIIYSFYKSVKDNKNEYFQKIYDMRNNTVATGEMSGFEENCLIFLGKNNVLRFNGQNQSLFIEEERFSPKGRIYVKNKTNITNISQENLYVSLDNGNVLFVNKGDKPYAFMYKRKEKKLVPIPPPPVPISNFVTKDNFIKLQNGDIYIQNSGHPNLIYHYDK